MYTLMYCCLVWAAVMLLLTQSSAMPADMIETDHEDNYTMFTVSSKLRATKANCPVTEYVLALQNECGFISIHGLWPDPESACEYCTDEVFNTSKLSSSTLAGMEKYWPTCESGSNESFWSHEWSKHGTCSGMTQDAYFSEGLSLFSKYSSQCSSTCNLCFTPTFSYEGKC